MIVVEITGADDEGALRTWYFSDRPYVTKPDDTPPHTVFEPALEQAADIGVYVFSDGMTGGGSTSEIGETIIVNGDGDFDELEGYGFDGRDVVVRFGEEGGRYPADFATVIRGTAAGVEATFGHLIIRLQDRQAIFDRPAQENLYAGDNVLPDGVEGGADDKGQPKPLAFGRNLNITPAQVNPSKLVYQVNDGAVFRIDAVYVGGVAWTKGANYSTAADLMAATLTPSSATFATCLREGLFRLSDNPADGEVTADITEGLQLTGGGRDAAGILEALYNRALQAGFGHPQEESDT